MDSNQKLTRRNFLKNSALAAAAIPFLGAAQSLFSIPAEAKSVPLPAGSQEVSESDAVASAIGYKSDVKKVDYAKYPQRKKPEAKNQFCKSCALYTSVNESWGKCQMLTSGLVSAEGWCGSWNPKSK